MYHLEKQDTSLQRKVEEHHRKYISKVKKGASVHLRKANLEEGSKVLIKKDFDANQRNRKRKLDEGFYEGESGVIEGLTGNNMYMVKVKGVAKCYTKGQLKVLD